MKKSRSLLVNLRLSSTLLWGVPVPHFPLGRMGRFGL